MTQATAVIAWESVDAVPPARGVGPKPRFESSPFAIVLQPGEIVRKRARALNETNHANRYFQLTGRLDYHACTRMLGGKRYLYIWRDAAPEAQA